MYGRISGLFCAGNPPHLFDYFASDMADVLLIMISEEDRQGLDVNLEPPTDREAAWIRERDVRRKQSQQSNRCKQYFGERELMVTYERHQPSARPRTAPVSTKKKLITLSLDQYWVWQE